MTTKTAVKNKKEQPECPECGSKVVLYRIRTNDYLCRRCGEIFKKDEGRY